MTKFSTGVVSAITISGLLLCAGVPLASAAPQPPVPGGAVDAFPGAPTPFQSFDWKQRTIDYDDFVYDWSAPGDYPTILADPTHYNMSTDTYKMPSYYGDTRIANDGHQEALGQLASVVGASLVGVNKSNQGGRNYVDMSRTFYHPNLGVALNTPMDPNGSKGGGSWWYTTTANVLYYMLGDQYPSATDMSAMLRSIADNYYDAVVNVGGSAANFGGQGFNFETMTKNTGSRNEGGDGAAGTAAILLWAYEKFGDAKYLQGAKWSMDYLERSNGHLYYEILPVLSPYIAARMNAEFGTTYDVSRHFANLISGSTVRGGWGTIEANWNGYDVSGMQGSRVDDGGYAFAMNSFSAGLFAATAKYDPRQANTVGRWLLNVSNAARFLYADQMPSNKQYHGARFTNDPANVIAYEGLRYTEAGQSPRATGDPSRYGSQWGLDPQTTDLGLYGASWVGFLGGVVSPTNVSNVLRIDLNATDFFGDSAYPTYLYYNPKGSPANVQVGLSESSSIYDAVSDSLLESSTGTTTVMVPPGSSRVIVIGPADPSLTRTANQTLINGNIVGYRTGTPDIAFGRPATTSSQQNGNLASHLTDGTPAKRWESLATDPQWVTVDLGSNVTVNRVVMRWEAASAKNFEIQVSRDNASWSTVYATSNGPGGAQTVTFAPTNARYLRVYMTQRNTSYAYSMYDLEVYRDDLAASAPVSTSSIANGNLGSYLTDSTTRTRWESQSSSPQWVSVDLGQNRTVDRVIMRWEAASAKAFQVQLSTDNATWSTVYSTTSGPGGVQAVTFTPATARYVRVYMTERNTNYAYSMYDLEVYRSDLAAFAPATASSVKNNNLASYLTDGSTVTRWESQTADPQWAQVDLGQNRTVGRVTMRWEAASAKAFQVLLSSDGTNWSSVYSTAAGPGGVQTVTFTPTSARFVRVHMTARNTTYAYSMYDLEVYAQ